MNEDTTNQNIPTPEEVAAADTAAITAIMSLTDGQIVDLRYKKRAMEGSRVAIPFFQSALATGNVTLISSEIPLRFTIDSIEVLFPSGTTDKLSIYVLVSNENNATNTGYNVLSPYSPTPYLVGDGERVRAESDIREFKENQYIKVYAVNTSTTAYDVKVVIRIKTYPLASQASN